MQIRTDRSFHATALESRLAVIPEPVHDATERFGAWIEQRAAHVILEARQRLALSSIELALEQDVADHPPAACDRLVRKETRARHEHTVATAIPAPEKLIAAANGQQGGACGHRFGKRLSLRRQIGRDERLFAVLPSAHVEEVVCAWAELVAEPDRFHLELLAAELGPPREDRDVAAVRVDVQIVRIEMSDTHFHNGSSQYARTSPRSVRMPRSASMAV